MLCAAKNKRVITVEASSLVLHGLQLATDKIRSTRAQDAVESSTPFMKHIYKYILTFPLFRVASKFP